MHAGAVNSSSLVYGACGVEPDDPAELFHEASKIYPSLGARAAWGARLLDTSPELQEAVRRAVKRSPQLPTVPLPPPEIPPVPLGDVLRSRRSERTFGCGSLALADLSALLYAAYGVTGSVGRSVPSGGALYPLEIYSAALKVEGLLPGLYHYDPLAHVLEQVRAGDGADALVRATAYPEIVRDCAALFAVSGMFWRTRFKYGLRGYRFALIEAGHVAQNVLLASAALGLAAVPLGGFFDCRIDAFLGIDGVNESALYAICVGARAWSGR